MVVSNGKAVGAATSVLGMAVCSVVAKVAVTGAVLGVRPEDCSITTAAKGALKGTVYTTELIGDHTLVTMKIVNDFLSVKAPKDYVARSGEVVGVTFAKSQLFVFDSIDGRRIR